MKSVVPVTVELDRQVNVDVEEWAESEKRSKRRHVAVLIRKLVALRTSHPDDLKRLGLLGTPN